MRYHIRVMRDSTNAGIGRLGRVVAECNDASAAKRLAGEHAGRWHYGVAIVDTLSETIDWGDELTDFAGRCVEHV